MMEPLLMLLYDFLIFVVQLLVLAVVFYLAGVLVVGKKRALFSDAFAISLLGTIISSIFIRFIPQMVKSTFNPRLASVAQSVGVIISLVGLLLLIKNYYETGWLGALAVAILAVIVFMVLAFILAFLLVLPFFFLI
ncbi:MAG: hypothetical protein ACE5OV_00745 [Candidatus Bathyarchaeia archaeon]